MEDKMPRVTKKIIFIILGFLILIAVGAGIFYYFKLKKDNNPSEVNNQALEYKNSQGDLVNAQIDVVRENNTIAPNYRKQYKKEQSVYLSCNDGKITIKYRDQEKEMSRDDYDDLWKTLENNGVWDLPDNELGPMSEGGGTETVRVELGNFGSNKKTASFEVMNPGPTNVKQFNIINKMDQLRIKYFPS